MPPLGCRIGTNILIQAHDHIYAWIIAEVKKNQRLQFKSGGESEPLKIKSQKIIGWHTNKLLKLGIM